MDTKSDIQETNEVLDQLKYCSCDSEYGDHCDGDREFELMGDRNEPMSPDRLRQLEEEQELLNGSLMALTTHFAQVQLRLKQIMDANEDQREELLKELEQFANRGIPDIRHPHVDLMVHKEPGISIIAITLSHNLIFQKKLVLLKTNWNSKGSNRRN